MCFREDLVTCKTLSCVFCVLALTLWTLCCGCCCYQLREQLFTLHGGLSIPKCILQLTPHTSFCSSMLQISEERLTFVSGYFFISVRKGFPHNEPPLGYQQVLFLHFTHPKTTVSHQSISISTTAPMQLRAAQNTGSYVKCSHVGPYPCPQMPLSLLLLFLDMSLSGLRRIESYCILPKLWLCLPEMSQFSFKLGNLSPKEL